MVKIRRKSKISYGFGSGGIMSQESFPYFMFLYSVFVIFGVLLVIYRLRERRNSKNKSEENEDETQSKDDERVKKQYFKETLKKRAAAREEMFSSSSEEDSDNARPKGPVRRRKKPS